MSSSGGSGASAEESSRRHREIRAIEALEGVGKSSWPSWRKHDRVHARSLKRCSPRSTQVEPSGTSAWGGFGDGRPWPPCPDAAIGASPRWTSTPHVALARSGAALPLWRPIQDAGEVKSSRASRGAARAASKAHRGRSERRRRTHRPALSSSGTTRRLRTPRARSCGARRARPRTALRRADAARRSRALDVREQEGQGASARGEVGAHQPVRQAGGSSVPDGETRTAFRPKSARESLRTGRERRPARVDPRQASRR